MNHTLLTRLCGLGCIAMLTAPAHAGRPLQTEDAGVLDARACEVEGAAERLKADGQRTRVYGLQVGCGVGLNTQLALGAGRARPDGGDSERELRLAGKTGLWQGAGDAPPELALAYAFSWAKARGEKTRASTSEVVLAYSQGLTANHTVHLNLGHARDEQGKARSTLWGVAWEHAGFGAVTPVAEVFGDDRERPWWNLGLRYTAVADTLFFDAAYGRQFASGRPTQWSLGFTWAF